MIVVFNLKRIKRIAKVGGYSLDRTKELAVKVKPFGF
jgi:hypothetical protein